MKTESCPECSRILEIKSVVNGSTAVMGCRHCRKNFLITADEGEKAFPSKIKSFNWGACVFTGWWGLFNGMPWLFFVLIFLNPLLGLLTLLEPGMLPVNILANMLLSVLCIYMGVKGNRLSWRKKNWSSVENFEKYQSRWNIAGIIVLVISFIIGIAAGLNYR
jgi:hypothetical protein